MNDTPFISILMPAYNAAKHIQSAIESILNQTTKRWELIIINDGSDDQTAFLINTYADSRIKIVENVANLGLTKDLNIGLQRAQGEFIARLDADDLCTPDRLAKQLSYLGQHPETALVGSWAQIIDDDGKIIGYRQPPFEPEALKFNLLFFNPLVHSSIFFRRSVAQEMGGYNEQYRRAQDFEFYSRLTKKYIIGVIPEYLVQYREHSQSVTLAAATKEEAQTAALQIVKQNWEKYLDLPPQIFPILSKTLFSKNKQPSFRELWTSWRWLQKLFTCYIKKEHLSSQTSREIKLIYNHFRRKIIKKILR